MTTTVTGRPATGRRRRTGGPGARLRTFAGPAVLLALLGLVAAALVTGAPRLTNDLADRSLHADLGPLPHQVRDLTIEVRAGADGAAPTGAAGALERFHAALPQPLPALVDQRWQAAAVAADTATASGDVGPLAEGGTVRLGLRTQTGLPEAARLTAGTWPRTNPGQPVQVAVSQAVADTLALRPGVRLGVAAPGQPPADLLVTGVFQPARPTDPLWAAMPQAVEPLLPVNDGDPFVAVAVTDPAGLDAAGRAGLPVTHSWRYRFDHDRITSSTIEPVAAAVGAARRTQWLPGATVQTSLDTQLVRFGAQLTSVRNLLAVVQAGLLASLLGLILLAARVAVQTRRAELTLLRSRGASLAAIGRHTLAEAALPQPAAVAAGALLALAAPGRDGGTWWALPLIAAVTTAAVPVFAMAGQRHVAVVTGRQDLTRTRPSARRVTVEVTVLLAAVGGLVLLRRRGLDSGGDVDVYLAAVPVLLAAAVALLTLRALPWPLRLLDRAAARARGALLFLGVARAGRGTPVTTAPLAVLVVAVSTGVFSAVVTDTVGRARDTAADLSVPADAWLTGYAFTPDTAGRLADVDGVRALTPVRIDSNRPLRSGTDPQARTLGTARIMVVDAPAFARVAAASGVDVDVPAVLRAAVRGDGPVPAVVSPGVAAAVDDTAAADVQSRLYPFRVAGVVDTFPGVDLGTDRFVVLPWQALTEYEHTPIVANRYLLATDDHDPAVLLRTADDGQRRWQSAVLGSEVDAPEVPAQLLTRRAYREGLDRTGANDVLTLAFTVGAVGGSALAVLAVGFAVLADARARARLLSRLRTLGFSEGQGRRLLVYELVPLVGVAALAGAAVGVALPGLLGPTLGLSAFTPGVTAGWYLDPLVVGAVLGLVAVGLTAGLGVEILVNRRTRPAEALRLGEENP
ncbi:FtsX-like permease family protein [Micromonospora sagamiensis]|uniref:Putative ABC transport system permease protein n=1 Tax=Micromonospora sagamiensis TaxID=47875 RepID=A0A562WH42_9ACTN|nr:FtsX-like permease family protein [Micromonospora sagamiensis]TWJ29207.1 putative ABC transport system permease protein [Micromonospora sagamiensis]BCL17768.1 membrane protein [Micromonospora sagamiensis]